MSGIRIRGIDGYQAAAVLSAFNGVSKPTDTSVVLGQAVGAVGNPAALASNREIPMAGFSIIFSGAGVHDFGTSAARMSWTTTTASFSLGSLAVPAGGFQFSTTGANASGGAGAIFTNSNGAAGTFGHVVVSGGGTSRSIAMRQYSMNTTYIDGFSVGVSMFRPSGGGIASIFAMREVSGSQPQVLLWAVDILNAAETAILGRALAIFETGEVQVNSQGLALQLNDVSCVFTINSTTQAVGMVRMTTAQKNAIASPRVGSVLYDTTLNKLCVYTGAIWETVTSV